VFPVSRTLEEAGAADAARLDVIHGEACRMLGAAPVGEAAPAGAP